VESEKLRKKKSQKKKSRKMDGLLDFSPTDVMLKLKEMKNWDTCQRRRGDTSKSIQ